KASSAATRTAADRSMAVRKSFSAIHTGAITSSSTSIFTGTMARDLEQATRPDGREWWARSPGYTDIWMQRGFWKSDGARPSKTLANREPQPGSRADRAPCVMRHPYKVAVYRQDFRCWSGIRRMTQDRP